METGERMLTTGEAAALCGVSRSTLRRAATRGQITAWHTPGGHLRFSEGACLQLAAALGRGDLELVGRRYDRMETAAAIEAGDRRAGGERHRRAGGEER